MTYPGDYAELRSRFRTDAACLDYLDLLRWPVGFVCPRCQGIGSWRLPNGRHKCQGCRRRVSATAGTIFHRTRTPLTLWFAAGWEMTTRKNGVSALYIQQSLGIGSYQTAWAMLHRFRTVMVLPGAREGAVDEGVDQVLPLPGGQRGELVHDPQLLGVGGACGQVVQQGAPKPQHAELRVERADMLCRDLRDGPARASRSRTAVRPIPSSRRVRTRSSRATAAASYMR